MGQSRWSIEQKVEIVLTVLRGQEPVTQLSAPKCLISNWLFIFGIYLSPASLESTEARRFLFLRRKSNEGHLTAKYFLVLGGAH